MKLIILLYAEVVEDVEVDQGETTEERLDVELKDEVRRSKSRND